MQSEAGPSDPRNLERTKRPNPLDMSHDPATNEIYTSSSHSDNAIVRGLLDGNEIGLLLQFNSGLPVNISANQDLNKDTTNSDRPLFVPRNSLYLPARQVIVEMKNMFNTKQLSGINTSTAVDAAGNPLSAIPSDPYDFVNPSGYEQRKLQLGFKVKF